MTLYSELMSVTTSCVLPRRAAGSCGGHGGAEEEAMRHSVERADHDTTLRRRRSDRCRVKIRYDLLTRRGRMKAVATTTAPGRRGSDLVAEIRQNRDRAPTASGEANNHT
jgi:hypothetical protein